MKIKVFLNLITVVILLVGFGATPICAAADETDDIAVMPVEEIIENPGAAAEIPSVPIDAEHFPDEGFRIYLSTHYDVDKDNFLSETEIISVTAINTPSDEPYEEDHEPYIEDVTGIEYLPYLEYLEFGSAVSNMDKLDVGNNPRLRKLDAALSELSAIDVSKNEELTELVLPQYDYLKEFSLPVTGQLETLTVEKYDITRHDLSGFPNL